YAHYKPLTIRLAFHSQPPTTTALTFFFFNDTATPEIYTLSLHDALPIWRRRGRAPPPERLRAARPRCGRANRSRARQGRLRESQDRKSTRLNSSHDQISYAVFCLKKKKKKKDRVKIVQKEIRISHRRDHA